MRRVLEGGAIRWPAMKLGLYPVEPGKRTSDITTDIFDARALLAWFDQDRLIAKLDVQIDELADDGRAIPTEERKAEAARLKAEILILERQEAALMEMVEGEGLRLWRRHDADPRAVLGLADSFPGLRPSYGEIEQ